jgi:uncharacterized YigZ family protein
LAANSYRTIASELRFETEKVKGSRFIATAAPVASIEDAEAFIARVSAEFADATHNCWAFRLGASGGECRSSDADEPSGSAGRPILHQIEGQGLTATAVVVSRYFGGTKLGVGGLVRAYGHAALEALRRAEQVEVVITRAVRLGYPYGLTSAVDAWIANQKVAVRSASYGESVSLVVAVPAWSFDALLDDLRERTAGRVRIETA